MGPTRTKSSSNKVQSFQQSALNFQPSEDYEEPSIDIKYRTINICLESYQNIKSFFPVADIQTTLTYGDNNLGQTTPCPIIDDSISINQCFSFTIDANNAEEVDALISSPVTLIVEQIQGTMDKDFYPQLQLNSGIPIIPSVRSFESVVSIYEGFNTKSTQNTSEFLDKNKKGKKGERRLSERSNRSEKRLFSVKNDNSIKNDEEPKRIYEPIPFGMCCLDLLPLFYGHQRFTDTLLLKPMQRYADDLMMSFKAHPKLLVTVSMDESLGLPDPTFLNLTLETIYNLPEVMSDEMEYWSCTMLPMLHGKKAPILFTNPAMVTTTRRGISKLWPGTTRASCDANATLYRTPLDTKDVIYKFESNIEDYIIEDSPRLEFVMIKRHLMLRGGVSELIGHIRKYRKIVMEFYVTAKETRRSSISVMGKMLNFERKKFSKGQYLHLMAILDIGVLLYPGVKQVRVAAPLTTFSAEEAAQYGGLEDSFFIPMPKKEVKEGKEREGKDVPKKVKSVKGGGGDMAESLPSRPVPPPEPEPSVPIFNEEGKPCFVMVTLQLSNPLAPKRNIEDLREELICLLKEKEEHSRLGSSLFLTSCMSSEYYQQVLSAMITDLNKKYLVFTMENQISKDNFSEICKQFVDFLRKEGIYESYVVAITKATSLLVSKEKKPLPPIGNDKEFNKFAGDIFVFLLSKMNMTVNSLICHGMDPLKMDKKTDKYFYYHKEAIDTGRPEMAERYCLERICNDSSNPEFWFDYGIQLLRKREDDTAYECIKEALILDNKHLYSLLVLGALLQNKGQKEDSEMVFLNLMAVESKWPEGWAILYLFYQKTENYAGMDKTIEMATKYGDLTPPSEYFRDYEDLVWTSTICPQTIFFRAAMLLLKLRLYEWSELALAHEINSNPGLVHYLLAAICYKKELYQHALDHLDQTLKYYGPSYAVASLNGHCLYALERYEEAEQQYYFALESFDRPIHLHLVSLNLAKICGKAGKYSEAIKLVLLACKYNPSPYTWFLAGTFYYEANDLLSAEECFSEGNALDNRYAEIWGYLSLVNYKLGRPTEGELCLDQARKNRLSDEKILQLIREEFDVNENSDIY